MLRNNHPATRVADDSTLYDTLDAQGILVQPNSSVFGHLVRQGEVGMCSDNGKPYFLAPGRHILWSPLNKFKGSAKISDTRIKNGKVEIITVDRSQIGLYTDKGDNKLLEPGQYVLHQPQVFQKFEQVNKDYVKLGTHHRISVPIGNVAVAYNEGKRIIITPEPLKVDDAHKDYIICTDGKMFTIDSPTFIFNQQTGFQSVQMEDLQLDELVVNTSEMISLSVEGSVRYQIKDPVRAFLKTDGLIDDIKRQAYATLTSVFSQLSINEIASSLATTTTTHTRGKGKEKAEDAPHDMLHHATSLFMKEFESVVEKWGVEAQLVNISKMRLVDKTFRDTVQSRAQQSMDANTRLAVVEIQTDVELQEADRKRQKAIIDAEGQAEAVKRAADARVYAAQKDAEAAKLLTEQPLAERLAVMKGQAEIASALGDKTVITDMKLGEYGVKGTQGQMLWLHQRDALKTSPDVENARRLSQSR